MGTEVGIAPLNHLTTGGHRLGDGGGNCSAEPPYHGGALMKGVVVVVVVVIVVLVNDFLDMLSLIK